jgi:uncharacterized protein (DUF2252 family)
VKLNTESKHIQAKDVGLLAHWYYLLTNMVKKDTPPRLVYNPKWVELHLVRVRAGSSQVGPEPLRFLVQILQPATKPDQVTVFTVKSAARPR